MKNRSMIALGLLAAFVIAVVYTAVFKVDQREQALILQFGEWVRTVDQPGLHFKIPFIQEVIVYEKRVLQLNPESEQVLLSDQKRMYVDTYLRYRIEDPRKFYQSVNNETLAASRLSDMVISAMRQEFGKATLATVLSPERNRLMEEMKRRVAGEAEAIGVSITDLRIRRADLPDSISQAVYDRIKSERAREVADFRAQGEEAKIQIIAGADREARVIVAEAEQHAQRLKGEGDLEAIQIKAKAFAANPQFQKFYFTMQGYYTALDRATTSMIVTPGHEFLRLFDNGAVSGAARR